MRKPRTKLQVSTFPFLAVLLCAMGSLLLLLFMMDRRAKIASQHQVSAMHAERKKRSKEEEDARNAEWEKAKERLHQTLLAQQGQLDVDALGLQGQLDQAGKSKAIIIARHEDLAKQIKSEATKVGDIQLLIAGQQAGLHDASKAEKSSQKELMDAAKELADLEIAFQALRALKAKQTPVYSLVPYRGKRGDGRPPIYVECVRGGVLFHPEKQLLVGADFTPAALRNEIERHAGPLVAAKPAPAKTLREAPKEKAGAYVLFLVRPDGIPSYYLASGALVGLQLDFGYELVDQDWVLDIPSDPSMKPGQPLQVAWPKTPPKTPSVGMPAPGGSGPGGAIGPPPGIGAPPGIGSPPGIGAPRSLGERPGIGLPTGPTSKPAPIGLSSYGGGGGPSFVPTSRIAPPVPVASTDNNPPSFGGPGGTNVGPGNPTPKTNGPGQATGGQGGSPVGLGNPTPKSPGPAGGGQGVSPSNAPVTGNVAGQPKDAREPNEPRSGSNPVGAIPFGPEPAKKKTTPPVRTVGERDFVITIDCYADRVNVFPGGTPFRWTNGNSPATDKAFVDSIANLIARRQASVRPGEQPYRPVIRFQVTQTGLRMYYHTYPLLERLGVPMTRENVED